MVGWLCYFVLEGEKWGKGEERGDEKKNVLRLKKYLTITIIVKINIFRDG